MIPLTCHHCARFDPGAARCTLHDRPVDPARDACRDHSSGVHPDLPPRRLCRLEADLFGERFVVAARLPGARRAHAAPFCGRCRARIRAARFDHPGVALLFRAASDATAPLAEALLDDERLERSARDLPPGPPPAERLAALLREPPPACPAPALCARCIARVRRDGEEAADDVGGRLVALLAALCEPRP